MRYNHTMFIRGLVVAVALAFAGGIAHAESIQPADFTDPNLRPAYTGGGNNPIEWAPKYTTDSYAWTEADRSILRQAANQRRLLENNERSLRNSTEQSVRFRALVKTVRKTGTPKQLYIARTAKLVRMDKLRFVGRRSGPGLVGRLPQTRVKGGAPTFSHLFASEGGDSFSFGSSLQNSSSDAKPFHIDLNQ